MRSVSNSSSGGRGSQSGKARGSQQKVPVQNARNGKPLQGQRGTQAAKVPSPRGTVLERLVGASPGESVNVIHDGGDGGDPFNGKAYKLDVLNAAEDIPRVIRGHVKVKQVECGVVLRPHDGQGILVHSEGGQAWHWTGLDSDVPRRPQSEIQIPEARAILAGAQGTLPSQGPITLRGQWSAKISCDQGQPRVSLQRKVASYGMLYIHSDAVKGLWRWKVARAEKWFSRTGQSDGEASSLLVAIQQGLASAMGLLGEACSVRDSRRRAALDSEYAEAHPIKPAREGKDPTTKFNPKEPKAPATPATSGGGRKSAGTASGGAGRSAGGTNSSSTSTVASTNPAPSARTGSTSVQAPPTRRRTATPQSVPATPAPQPPPPADVGEIDPAKDNLLLDAFGNALDQALANLK